MSRHTKDRKRKEKQVLKQKAKLQEELKEEKLKFDILNLLKTEHIDTKPNMAKFLKQHVSSIRTLNWSKMQFYPTFKYEVTKISVRFLDDHELIFDKTKLENKDKYTMYYGTDSYELKAKDLEII